MTVFFLPVSMLWAQVDIDGAREALREAGYANIRVVQNDSLVVVAIQNDAYKLQASGIAAAIRLLGEKGILEASDVRMIVTDYDVPRVSLKYDSVLGEWDVSHRLDRKAWEMVRREKKTSSSFGKVDITVYPQVSLMNLIITQVYQSLWQLNPAVEVSLWPGSKLSYQVKIPLFNDGYGEREGKIHPGMVTLSQRFRIPGDVYGKATVGVFSNNRWGAALELQYRMPFNPRFWVEGYFSMLGLCYFDGFQFHMDPKLSPFFGIGAGYYWPLAETSFTARIRENLLEDYSIRFDMIRHFRYVSIGFYLEKGLNSYAKTNGGFKFSVALPPHRYKRYKYVPRVTTSGQMGMSYNANNEQRWYREVKFEASDNIMNDNAFNPYYIKKEIKKLNK
ncbi:MAG: hypothetical protein MJY92_02440 [Bacteroidales bacterium]|nr:hypothetical protein [Bacteroidales bacterium]